MVFNWPLQSRWTDPRWKLIGSEIRDIWSYGADVVWFHDGMGQNRIQSFKRYPPLLNGLRSCTRELIRARWVGYSSSLNQNPGSLEGDGLLQYPARKLGWQLSIHHQLIGSICTASKIVSIEKSNAWRCFAFAFWATSRLCRYELLREGVGRRRNGIYYFTWKSALVGEERWDLSMISPWYMEISPSE